jgi:hypothetical protein
MRSLQISADEHPGYVSGIGLNPFVGGQGVWGRGRRGVEREEEGEGGFIGDCDGCLGGAERAFHAPGRGKPGLVGALRLGREAEVGAEVGAGYMYI